MTIDYEIMKRVTDQSDYLIFQNRTIIWYIIDVQRIGLCFLTWVLHYIFRYLLIDLYAIVWNIKCYVKGLMKEFVQLKLNWGFKYYKTNTTNSSFIYWFKFPYRANIEVYFYWLRIHNIQWITRMWVRH